MGVNQCHPHLTSPLEGEGFTAKHFDYALGLRTARKGTPSGFFTLLDIQ